MADAGLILPRPEGAIFADTQDEPQAVYEWLGYLRKRLTYPVHIVTAGKLSDNLLTFKTTADGRRFNKTGVPWFTRNADGSEGKIKHRKCTKDFKLVPIIKLQRQLTDDLTADWKKRHKAALKELSLWAAAAKAARKLEQPEPIRPFDAWRECQADPLVVSWVGISLDEIVRMKDSRVAWILQRWPLVEARMSRHDCLRWMKANGHPEPPRSACVFCPFRNQEEWRLMREKAPQDFQRAVEFERELHKKREGSWTLKAKPFIHRQLVPLDQADFDTEEDRGQLPLDGFNRECEGMCGV